MMGNTILIAILDWGLGHATRMVPVIDALERSGARLILASSGGAGQYLRERYHEHKVLEMPSRDVVYGKEGAGVALARRAVLQPGLNRRQQRWTRHICEEMKVDAIISDNVYGAWHPSIPTAIVSHQLGLPAPVFKAFFDRVLASWLQRFTEVWVPDMPGEHSLAGALIQNKFLKQQPVFLGRLSRLKPLSSIEKNTSLLALISGPEPQRTAMEQLALKRFDSTLGKKVLVRGTHKNSLPNQGGGQVHVCDFLDDKALAKAIQNAELVYCRSGYSTLCDLIAMGAQAITTPTPQQPEQIYLAERCDMMGWFQKESADGMDSSFVQKALPDNDASLLAGTLKQFLHKIKAQTL